MRTIDIFSGEWKPEAVVLAAGDYPQARQPLDMLRSAPVVVCCDGAAEEYVRQTGRLPDAIVGDCDSLSADFRQRYPAIIHSVSEQETNDQTKAIRYVRSMGLDRIAILGATGKREDHTIGNISLLADYAEEGTDVRMLTDRGVFVACCEDCEFRTYKGQEISIFSLGATGLRGEGLDYPIYDFSKWWQGTLNAASGNRAVIHATQGPFLVFLSY